MGPWISIALMIAQLVAKIPAVKEWLDRILGRLDVVQAKHPVRAAREAVAFAAALRAKIAQVAFAEKHGLTADAASELGCPIEAYEKDLAERFPDAAPAPAV